MEQLNNEVELLGFYGGDRSHASSAWVSTNREITPEKKARIPKMLAKLAADGHHTPFEKSSLHFLVTCDTASHIHLLKHRIGVSINGESARYKELKEDKAYLPVDWTGEPTLEMWLVKLQLANTFYQTMYHKCLEDLTPILGRKRAKESARFFLPYTNQLTLDVMFNFRSFAAFQKLRNDEHAQLEIRNIAEKMRQLVQETGQFNESLKGFGLYDHGIEEIPEHAGKSIDARRFAPWIKDMQ